MNRCMQIECDVRLTFAAMSDDIMAVSFSCLEIDNYVENYILMQEAISCICIRDTKF